MKSITVESTPAETRQRLLDAAGEVFAEKGFRGATVREICKRAGANVSAVNYYFGDKERLYAAVLRYLCGAASWLQAPELGATSGAKPEERLHAFVRLYLRHLLDKEHPAWPGKLIAREMSEPTGALDEFIETMILPMTALLTSIVGELLGPHAREEEVELSSTSIFGQCLFFHQNRAINVRLKPDFRYDAAGIEVLAGHITRFSLAAIKGLKKEKKWRQLQDAFDATHERSREGR